VQEAGSAARACAACVSDSDSVSEKNVGSQAIMV